MYQDFISQSLPVKLKGHASEWTMVKKIQEFQSQNSHYGPKNQEQWLNELFSGHKAYDSTRFLTYFVLSRPADGRDFA